jgi:sialic acid synthase SpsE
MKDSIRPVNLGGVLVGDEYPTVFMAEVGTFFNQDIDLAIAYLNSIVQAGAQIFKTEILHDPEVCLPDSGIKAVYNYANGVTEEDYRQLIERKIVPLEDYDRLFTICQKLDIPFICSVYDTVGIDFLVEKGGAAIKFARDNVTNIGLIRYAAKTKLPILFDAGNLYLSELARAVELVRESGSGDVIILHHPAANPAPASVHNLRVMQTYKQAFRAPVGLACHYRGDEILYAAVAIGANIIEKGVVNNPNRNEQDVVSAAHIDELPDIVSKIRNCYEAMGQNVWEVKEPRDQMSWKGLTAKNDIARGEKLNIKNVGFAFPPKGIAADHWDLVDGKFASQDIAKGEVILWPDIRENSC